MASIEIVKQEYDVVLTLSRREAISLAALLSEGFIHSFEDPNSINVSGIHDLLLEVLDEDEVLDKIKVFGNVGFGAEDGNANGDSTMEYRIGYVFNKYTPDPGEPHVTVMTDRDGDYWTRNSEDPLLWLYDVSLYGSSGADDGDTWSYIMNNYGPFKKVA